MMKEGYHEMPKMNERKNNLKSQIYIFLCFIQILTAVGLYTLVPVLLNYPPFSEETEFLLSIEPMTHLQQYIILGAIYVIILLIFIKIAFKDIKAVDASKCVIAYEPIWAIGTGVTATTEQAQEVCKGIRECIEEVYGFATAKAIRIQYGGSVTAATAADLFAQPDIDGGLVGGASIKADFGKIVNH